MKLVWGLLVIALVTVADAAPKSAPISIVLVIDRSGSMTGTKMDAAKEGARAALDGLRPDDQIAVITFDSEARVVLPMVKPGTDRKPQRDKIDAITPGGGTNILPALKLAKAELDNASTARKHVILMTDGEAPTDGIAELVGKMKDAHETVSCIGVDGADRNMLQMIADAGQGRVYMVTDVKALPKVVVKEIDAARQAP
jgi:Ca-activated chloride channel homolog